MSSITMPTTIFKASFVFDRTWDPLGFGLSLMHSLNTASKTSYIACELVRSNAEIKFVNV
jgi:hypothetical protein